MTRILACVVEEPGEKPDVLPGGLIAVDDGEELPKRGATLNFTDDEERQWLCKVVSVTPRPQEADETDRFFDVRLAPLGRSYVRLAYSDTFDAAD
jgi:hypothetical protein